MGLFLRSARGPAASRRSSTRIAGPGGRPLNRFVLPLTVVVLLALFLFQKGGTERVGHLFGPVMVLWFAVIAVSGALQIAEVPRVLAADVVVRIDVPVAGWDSNLFTSGRLKSGWVFN
jgi:hypothetical protein